MERRRESCFARRTDTARWALHWGVLPKAIRSVLNTDELGEEIDSLRLSEGTVVRGDSLVFVAGAPLLVHGTTNLMHLRRVRERG